jgi:hypothetical protein
MYRDLLQMSCAACPSLASFSKRFYALFKVPIHSNKFRTGTISAMMWCNCIKIFISYGIYEFDCNGITFTTVDQETKNYEGR